MSIVWWDYRAAFIARHLIRVVGHILRNVWIIYHLALYSTLPRGIVIRRRSRQPIGARVLAGELSAVRFSGGLRMRQVSRLLDAQALTSLNVNLKWISSVATLQAVPVNVLV